MGKKGRKLLALFMVFAMIVTYSFSASILSVYADDEQGDENANAKAAASEEAAPTPPEPAAPAEPAEPAEPDTPAPADKGDQGTPPDNDTGANDGDGTGNDDVSSDDPAGEGGSGDSDLDQGEVITDPAATDEEEVIVEEEEEEYPEVTLHASAGGVNVTLHAPKGALPKGAKLDADRVSSQAVFNALEQRFEAQGQDMVDAVAIDVTPRDKNGHAVQPKKAVTVTFSGTGLSGNDIDVFRVSDDAGSITEMGTSVASANTQRFSTNHFTIYVSTGSVDDPNGDKSDLENNATDHRCIVEYHQTVALKSDVSSSYKYNQWTVTRDEAGWPYVSFNGANNSVFNNNYTSTPQYVTIKHTFRNHHNEEWQNELFYITLNPQTFTVTYKLKDVGLSDYTTTEEKVYIHGQATPPECSSTKTTEDGTEYVFEGWYNNQNFSGPKADLSNITSNRTVYARYVTLGRIIYKKGAISDAVTLPGENPLVKSAGQYVNLGVAFTDEKTFTGWNTASDGSGTPYNGRIKMPAGTTVLYAQWVDSKNQVSISYHDGKENLGTDMVTRNVRTSLRSDIPEHDGDYLFGGWCDTVSLKTYYPGQTVTPAHHMSLYAVWAPIRTKDMEITSLTAYGDEYTYNGELREINGVKEGEGNWIVVGSYEQKTWSPQQGPHTVTIKIYADVSNIHAEGTDAGQYAAPVSAPMWRTGDNGCGLLPLNTRIPVTNNLLVIKPVELTVSTGSAEAPIGEVSEEGLTADGQVTFEGCEAPQTFTHGGTAVTLVNSETLNMRTVNALTETGECENSFEFDWGVPDTWDNTLPASTAKKYNYTFKKGDIGILVVDENKVTFDKNAGSDPVDNMPASIVVTNADGITLPNNKPTRNGYEFLGWAKTPEATVADYQPGATLTGNDLVNGNLKLYAVWKKLDTPVPTAPTKVGGAGGNADGNAVVAFAPDADLVAEIVDNVTPEAAAIADNAAPKAAPKATPKATPEGTCALLNLFCAILTALLSLIMLVRYFGARRVENEETGEVTDARSNNGVRLASIIPAIGGIVAFVATENMTDQMGLTDKWTVMMVAILAVQAGVAVYAKLKENFVLEDAE